MMTFERILAVKLADLGDVLLTEPALRSLRSAYPHATIDVLTTPAASHLVSMLDHDLNVIPFDKHAFDSLKRTFYQSGAMQVAGIARQLKSRRYDAICIFHYLTTPAGATKFSMLAKATGAPVIAGLDNGRGSFLTHPVTDLGFGSEHVTEHLLKVAVAIGGDDTDPAPQIQSRNDDSSAGQRVNDDKTTAVLFPRTGPFAPGRNWPLASFVELADLLQSAGFNIVAAGGNDAREDAETIKASVPDSMNLAGATNLPQLADLVANAAVVVSGDSFPGHLAAALGTPLVSIFGPSNHHAWMPYGSTSIDDLDEKRRCIIRQDIPCAPCLYTGYRLGRRNGCDMRICLMDILPGEVYRAVLAVSGKQA
jgi:ADP-heptose:LPS heptosyltransferase